MKSAIVGAGMIGAIHARAVRAAGGRVVAVATRTPGDHLGADHSTTDWRSLLDSDVDVIHVCTPNHLHAEIAAAALAAGKHVVCEKPLAMDVDEAVVLERRARSSGLVAAVPFVYRFYGSVREARDLVDPASVRLLHGSYLQDWLARPSDSNWRVDPALGGASRAFADIGVHWCDLVEFVTGHRLVRVSARLWTSGRATEDAATVMFETDRGAIGSVVVSQVSPGRKNRLWFSIDGATASVQFDQENPDSLWIGGLTENRIVPREAGYLPVGHPMGYQDCFTAFVSDVYSGVRGAAVDGLPTFTDGVRAARITAAVLASAANDGWVEVPE